MREVEIKITPLTSSVPPLSPVQAIESLHSQALNTKIGGIMLEYSLTSPPILFALAIYYLLSAITTFDTRLIQAARTGQPYNVQTPKWTGVFAILYWIVLLVLLVLNWKIAIAAKIIQFILKVLPVLEMVGYYLMSPFLIPVNGKNSKQGEP